MASEQDTPDWLDKHPIKQTIATLHEILADECASEGQKEADIAELTRMQRRLLFLESKLGKLEIDLAPKTSIDGIAAQLANALSQLQNYKRDYQYTLLNAQNSFDAAFVHLGALLPYATGKGAYQLLGPTQKQVDAFVNRINKQQATIESQLQKIEMESQESQAFVDAVKADGEKVKQEAANAISGFTTTFNEMLNTRQRDFDTLFTALSEKNTENTQKLFDTLKQATDAERTKYIERLDAIQQDAETTHENIMDLFGLVADESVSGSYAKTFSEEQRTANLMKYCGLGVSVIAVLWVLVVFSSIFFWQKELSVTAGIAGVSLTALLVCIAIYLFSQSEKARKVAIWAKQLQLETTALPPFITDLDEAKKAELLTQMANRLFGNIQPPHEAMSQADSGYPTEKVFELFLKFLDAARRS